MGLVSGRYGAKVEQQVRSELERYMELLELVNKKLVELTAALRKASTEKKGPRIKGIGHLSEELLDREMGDWNRFANRRQVGSYTGLCPGEDSSGDTRMSLSIDKHGNPRCACDPGGTGLAAAALPAELQGVATLEVGL